MNTNNIESEENTKRDDTKGPYTSSPWWTLAEATDLAATFNSAYMTYHTAVRDEGASDKQWSISNRFDPRIAAILRELAANAHAELTD